MLLKLLCWHPGMQRELFGTDGIRGKANSYPLTPEMMVAIARSFSEWLKSETSTSQVVIGMDTRESSQMLADALASGLLSMGMDVNLLGVVPTPAVSFISEEKSCAGLMITASHNPASDNGVKFFYKGLKLTDRQESGIESFFGTDMPAPDRVGKKSPSDAASYVRSLDDLSLDGLRIVLDCANGAAYRIAPELFRGSGGD